MKALRFLLLAALLVASPACTLTTEPLAPEALNGSWAHRFDLPGFGDVLVLQVHGGVVSGIGSWAGEAGPSGTSSVTGAITGDMVVLDIVKTPVLPQPGTPRTDHFVGRLLSSTELAGTLTQGDVQFDYGYVRSQVQN
jgi:hypothetical protein